MLRFLSQLVARFRLHTVGPRDREAVLARQTSELEFLYDKAPVGMSLIDRELRYLRINQWLAEINGFSREDHLGKKLTEILPDLAASLTPYYRQVFKTGEAILDVEVTGTTAASDEPRCWLVSFHPLTDDDGQVWAASSIVQDITGRKRIEQDQESTNHRLRNILESIAGGFVSFDDEWRFRYVSRTAAETMQSSVEDMLGKRACDLFPAAKGSIFEEKFNAARNSGEPLVFEAYYGGLNATFQCHCYPSAEGLSVLFMDTTQNKKTLQRLRRSESVSRRLAAVVEQCNDFVGICTPAGVPIYFNQAGREMVGLEPDEEIADTHFLKYFAPEDHVKMTSVGIPALKEHGRWTGSVQFKNVKTGECTPSLWNVFVIEDPDGDLPEVWATVSPDLTEQKRMEEVLRESEQRALQASVAKSEFLANMSHEIRTPMAAILGYADLLLEHLGDARDRDHVAIIKRNGQHLLEVINDILDLSRIEAGKLQVDLQECDLPQLIADLQVLMHVRANEKELQFDVHFDGPVPRTIHTDPTRLRQVLINLLGNAIKFTNQGKVQLTARCLAGATTAMIEFEVSDTGIGMSDEQQRGLFQPFAQGDSSVTRAFGGSGLGLAISKRLVEMLSGEIALKSEPGNGSRFFVRIPIPSLEDILFIEPRMDLATEPISLVTDPSLTTDRRRLSCRVLVVDDRRDIRYITQHFLENAGASVATAEDGQIALQAVQRAIARGQPYDVIVMDMQMPKVDGYRAAADLRASGVEQPIIALTADAMQGDRERCLLAGCDDYLSKPLNHASFVEMIAKYSQEVTLEQLRQRRST